MPRSTILETTAVLDGQLMLPGSIEVSSGEVVVRLVPEHGALPPTDARVITVRSIADAHDGLSFDERPRILHDPRLFLAAIASVIAQGRYVAAVPLHRELLRASNTRVVGIHPVDASPRLSARYATVMTRYLRDLRLMRAGELVLRTTLPLAEIAATAGFSDHAELTHVFSMCIGVSPSELRRQVHVRLVA